MSWFLLLETDVLYTASSPVSTELLVLGVRGSLSPDSAGTVTDGVYWGRRHRKGHYLSPHLSFLSALWVLEYSEEVRLKK